MSRAQSNDAKTIVFHVARFNYIEEDNFCGNPPSSFLKRINTEKKLTLDDAMGILQGPNTGLSEKCLDAYLSELELTEKAVDNLRQVSYLTVDAVPRSFEYVESEVGKSASERKTLPSEPQTIHFLVHCQLMREGGDGHSYQIHFEVRPVNGTVTTDGVSIPVERSSSGDLVQVVERYRYVASKRLQELCERTAEKQLRAP